MATSSPAAAPASPVAIKLSAPWERACAGEWLPMVVEMQRPDDATGALAFEAIRCDNPNVQIDTDLMQGRLELRPAEAYRCTLPIRVSQPCQVNLNAFEFAFTKQDEGANAPHVLRFKAAPKIMTVKPALGQEIETTLKPICRYEEGVKVSVTFAHLGRTPFRAWSLAIGPVAEIKAGKCLLQKEELAPGDRETVELVVGGSALELVHSATIEGQRGEFRQTFSVEPPPTPDTKRFRFLEPTRLAQDSIRVFRLAGDDRMSAEKRQEAFVLRGGERYMVEIEPRAPGVESVKLNGLGHQVQILKRESKGSLWMFTIDVAGMNLFRFAERLYYEVECRSGRFAAEIPVCLCPNWVRHAKFAATACAVLSLQGLIGLTKWIFGGERTFFESVSEFTVKDHLPLLGMLLSTPCLMLAIRGIDWVQYRLLR